MGVITERGDPRDRIANQLPIRHGRSEMEDEIMVEVVLTLDEAVTVLAALKTASAAADVTRATADTAAEKIETAITGIEEEG